MTTHVYFHRDFDGICSAAVFSSYMRATISPDVLLEYTAVDYDLRNSWSSAKLEKSSAIVDFLYHPDAEWWFDHHETTFVRKDWELLYMPDAQHVWRTSYKSCPRLIVDTVADPIIKRELRDRFSESLYWCDVIDSAGYESPEQVIGCAEPALQINATLVQDSSAEYLTFLIGCVERLSLTSTASLEEVQARYLRTKTWQERAIDYVKKTAIMSKGAAFIDYTEQPELFHRYAVYYLWPDAAFQVAVYKRGGLYRLTVGSNPWRQPDECNLGAICEQFGGGGHQKVAGVIAKSRRDALRIGGEIVRILRKELPFHQQLSFRNAVSEQDVALSE
jgi:oligoribonuclease NrnB/cAMP/cGMP phosphodiesterase (DHH superfamily)